MEQMSIFGVERKLAGKKPGAGKFLGGMEAVVPWGKLLARVGPCCKGRGKAGRKPRGLLLMPRIHFPRQWHNLSDPAMEDAIHDRRGFQRFLQPGDVDSKVPDETSILNFRHLLEKNGLGKALFEEVREHLEAKGLVARQGTIVDATLIAAPRSKKNKGKERGPGTGSTRKGNTWRSGMKASVGVDARSGLVHSVRTSTASEHDQRHMGDCLHGEEEVVCGDKGYFNGKDKRKARKAGIAWGVLDRAKRNHKPGRSQRKRNAKWSGLRAKVEHPFLTLKHHWGHRKTRYRGLAKNDNHLQALFALVNLYRSRKQLALVT